MINTFFFSVLLAIIEFKYNMQIGMHQKFLLRFINIYPLSKFIANY